MVVDERNKTLFVCVYQMPVMLIRIHGIIIMIYMIFWGYHIRNKQTKKIGFGTFAVCKNHGIRQRFELCRVPRQQGTRQTFGHAIVPGWLLYFAVGREWHTTKGLPWAFGALPCAPGTRQRGVSRSESIKFVNKIMIKITIYDVVVFFQNFDHPSYFKKNISTCKNTIHTQTIFSIKQITIN